MVLKALDKAVNNMDNMKRTYADLSQLHFQKLEVDPDSFRVSNTFPQKHMKKKIRDLYIMHLQRFHGVFSFFTAVGRLYHYHNRMQTQVSPEPPESSYLAEVSICCGRRYEQSVPLKRTYLEIIQLFFKRVLKFDMSAFQFVFDQLELEFCESHTEDSY